MEAVINGEHRALADGTTVSDLIVALDLRGRRIAVEVNRELVCARDFDGRVLRDGDQVEIVQFVGGG